MPPSLPVPSAPTVRSLNEVSLPLEADEPALPVLPAALPAGPCVRQTEGVCCQSCVNARKRVEDDAMGTPADPPG